MADDDGLWDIQDGWNKDVSGWACHFMSAVVIVVSIVSSIVSFVGFD